MESEITAEKKNQDATKETVTLGKEVTKENKQVTAALNKRIMYTSALLAFLSVCLLTVFLLIGYIPTKGGCLYQGPLSAYGVCNNFTEQSLVHEPVTKEDSEPISEISQGSEIITDSKKLEEEVIDSYIRKEYIGYTWYTFVDKYEFAHPSNWVVQTLVEDPTFLFIYSRNPNLPSSTINENISIVPISVPSVTMDDSLCQSLSENVITDAKDSFDTITLESYSPIHVNGKDACRISVISTVGTSSVRQIQHIFVNKNNPADSYVFTSTQALDTQLTDAFYNIIESFKQL